MGQKKIFAVVRVLNGVGLIVRALHKDAFLKRKIPVHFFIGALDQFVLSVITVFLQLVFSLELFSKLSI